MRFDISRLQRGYVAFAHDIIMAALSFALALYLRLGDDLAAFADDLLLEGTIVFTLTAGGVFWFMGLYKGIWRYASLSDLFAILRSATLTVLIFLLIMFVWTRLEGLPRSIIFILPAPMMGLSCSFAP
jgi:FlaA1/EpsC-like NDP-sugar epimerase